MYKYILLGLLELASCQSSNETYAKNETAKSSEIKDTTLFTFRQNLSNAAMMLTKQKVEYDASYFSIPYPNGDVPPEKGVCADVIIRAYRLMGVDLQKIIHEDMNKRFNQYPKKWGLQKTDKNIDHRRVPNLMAYFDKYAQVKSRDESIEDYLPGDIVCWELSPGITHIGIVVNEKSKDSDRYMIVHNIGGGQVMEDCLFKFKIIGHYYFEKN